MLSGTLLHPSCLLLPLVAQQSGSAYPAAASCSRDTVRPIPAPTASVLEQVQRVVTRCDVQQPGLGEQRCGTALLRLRDLGVGPGMRQVLGSPLPRPA